MKNKFLSFFSLFIVMTSFSQERNKSILKPYKLGFLYNFSSNENFIFDDVDLHILQILIKLRYFINLENGKILI